MTRVIWAEESETGLGFEIGPSYGYGDLPTRSQCVTEGQSSCSFMKILRVFAKTQYSRTIIDSGNKIAKNIIFGQTSHFSIFQQIKIKRYL